MPSVSSNERKTVPNYKPKGKKYVGCYCTDKERSALAEITRKLGHTTSSLIRAIANGILAVRPKGD